MPNKQNENIENLAEKLLNGSITTEERVLLENWYAETPSVRPEWTLQDQSSSDLQARILNVIQSRIRLQRKTFKLWKAVGIAAAILMASAAVMWLGQDKNPAIQVVQQIKTSTKGKITKVYLPDHSIVWLKGESRLNYPSKFGATTRNVTLHGEALFEVAKDRKHPFVINSGKYITRVLGTSFNINENAGDKTFKLTVLTGKVSISEQVKNSAKPTSPVIVTPGKVFQVLDAKALPEIIVAQESKKALILSGTEYDMNFENTGFEEIKNRIEKKFNVKIKADQTAYQNCYLSADVTDQSLINTLKVICPAIGSTYSINNLNEITITGGGCN
ncbi:FecR family protein [Pedobacter sp. N23S346]|uniref:FecR family protein n=1 Tax=Pedobacter sp. N23S346 TaxID=3402750 RepID=UPI003AD1024B